MKDRCLSDAVKDKESKTSKFIFNSEEEQKIEQFCVFALCFYIPAFFTSSRGCDAPINDLRLYKDLLAFKESDKILATRPLDMMDRLLWYLTPAVVMFSLFSEKVSEVTKSRMAAKLLSLERVEETKFGLPEFPAVEARMELWDFVTSQSWVFFDTIKLSADWLVQPPAEWEKSEDYRKAESFVKTVKLVNDTAERGIKFATDFAKSLTKESGMRQKISRKERPQARQQEVHC